MSDLTRDFFERFVAERREESTMLDFKGNIDLATRDAKTDIARDIVALANSAGGEIIAGVKEEKGVAVDVCPFTIPDDNADAFTLCIENIMRDRIEPRLSGVRIDTVPAENDFYVRIAVARSFAGPHAVRHGARFEFLRRANRQNVPMDYAGVRAAFLAQPSLLDRIRIFHTDRVNAVRANEVEIPLVEVPTAVGHLIPYDFLEPVEVLSLEPRSVHLPRSSAFSDRPTIDGRIAIEPGTYMSSSPRASYVKVYRTGVVEAVDADFVKPHYEQPTVWNTAVLNMCSSLFENGEHLLGDSVRRPVAAIITFGGMKGTCFSVKDPHLYRHLPECNVDTFTLAAPEVVGELDREALSEILEGQFRSADGLD
ncbi:MAG: ATP-binding protein [Pseudomonadota bacterium]